MRGSGPLVSGGGREAETVVELRHFLNVVRKRWVSVAVGLLLTLAFASAAMLLVTPRYTATTRMFFGVQGGESVTDLAQGSTFAEKQMASYAQVATSPLVLSDVIRRLGLDTTPDRLARLVVATPPADTVIIDISASDPDPEQAARIADAIGEQLATVAGELSPERSDGSQSVKATRLTAAAVPLDPSSPRVLRNLFVAGVLGLLVGLVAAIVRQGADTKIRNEQDLRQVTDATLLGAVGFSEMVPASPILMRDEKFSGQSEAMRRLRTNLQFVNIASEGPRSLVITSSIPGEGKSTTALNVAVAFADAGNRTILIDADLRRPSVAKYLGLEGGAGLTTVLIGRAEVEDVVQPFENGMLDILASGEIPPNPSELLGSTAMHDLLATLTQRYDMVLIDSPPLLPVTDSVVLSKATGGTLIVAGADRIHAPQLRTALESLETVGAKVVGVVLNKIARRESTPYAYGYGYGYASEERPADPIDGVRVQPTVESGRRSTSSRR